MRDSTSLQAVPNYFGRLETLHHTVLGNSYVEVGHRPLSLVFEEDFVLF